MLPVRPGVPKMFLQEQHTHTSLLPFREGLGFRKEVAGGLRSLLVFKSLYFPHMSPYNQPGQYSGREMRGRETHAERGVKRDPSIILDQRGSCLGADYENAMSQPFVVAVGRSIPLLSFFYFKSGICYAGHLFPKC